MRIILFSLQEEPKTDEFQVSSSASELSSGKINSEKTPKKTPKRASLRHKAEDKKDRSLTAEVKKICAKAPFKRKAESK